ncbi:MAG: Gfo/Idh/MocA family oxidoreductase [Atribacterota bacterium]|nr:Gfo/Idh/MocA family oxidoreductase [Atribacterota bacterium]
MEQINVGIIGSSYAAKFHARSYQECPDVNVVAVAARNEENLKDFCKNFKLTKFYSDYRKMLEVEDIQMVSVCVPNSLHKEVVIQAANAGKHVVCEKPLATTLEDCDEMIEACQENNVKLMYAEDFIFAPAIIRAKSIFEEGAIGNTLYIKARSSHSGSRSIYAQKLKYAGGGVLLHHGIHAVSTVMWLKEKSVIEVVGKTSKGSEGNLIHPEFEGEDWAAGILTFSDNTFSIIQSDYVTKGGSEHRFEMYGTKGNIRVNFTHSSPLLVYSSEGYKYAMDKAETTKGWTFPVVDEEKYVGYRDEIRHFVDCAKYNKEIKPGARAEDGREALEIVLAIYESAKESKPIKIK